MERGWREISPNCPRCGSSNTKFCYYNNYSLTQPRYFCKGCRRYWTKGGSLRNVPIGGGCRKSRRSRSSTLRLTTSNPHHHGLNASRSTSNSIFGHEALNNNELGHSYASPSGDLTHIVQPTCSSMNSEPPAIDLAVVYANFLSQKPENLDSMVVKLPNDESTHLGPSSQAMLQQEHTNIVDCASDPPLTQGLPIMPHINNEDYHNQMLLTEFSRPIRLHHHHGEISIPEELAGLPPLPGESLSQEHNLVPWTPSALSNNDQYSNLQPPRVLRDVESDSQLCNLFVGSWSPLDLPGFETSSSSSKP